MIGSTFNIGAEGKGGFVAQDLLGKFAAASSAPLNTHKPSVECSMTSDIA